MNKLKLISMVLVALSCFLVVASEAQACKDIPVESAAWAIAPYFSTVREEPEP